MTDLDGRSPRRGRIPTAEPAPTVPGAGIDPAGDQPARRVRRSGTAYDVSLKHSDPTSLDPAYIVRTGGAVDAEPGRTSRLAWTKGRRRPISAREAYNVFWRRKAARLRRLYAEPDKNRSILAKMPPTLTEALAGIPVELPPWDATRAVVKVQMPEQLVAIANAYTDVQQCSLPQLIELALYEMVTANVRSPSTFRAAYDQMREQTYQVERELRRRASADATGDGDGYLDEE